MKSKITITSLERTMIVAALIAFEQFDLADQINMRYAENGAADGPEVDILREIPRCSQ